jgi:hypothetical protein
MEAHMQPLQIREHQRARPFRPFRIILDDGRTFEVQHPSHLFVSTILVFIGVEVDAKGMPADSVMTNPGHVLRIEPLFMNGNLT